MDAGEEARSRQYKGTAMSDDEASKVCKISAFGIYDKSYRNEKKLISNDVIFLTNEHYFLYSLCGAFFFDSLRYAKLIICILLIQL